MVLSTLIMRASDGLPLSASVDDGEDNLTDQKRQCKMVTQKITANSAERASLESGKYVIHYLLSQGIVYYCISEASYPRKLAFSYLDELDREFQKSHGNEAMKEGVRPYKFVEFDTFMQKTKRVYQDTRATHNLDKLNTELQDVTRVMTKNIEDLLHRGHSLDHMSDLSSNLRTESKKYRRAAQRINWEAMLRQYIPYIGLGAIGLFMIWWMLF